MPNRLLPAQRRKAEVMIHRVGQEVDILRPDGTAVENQFGKVEDPDVHRTKVGTEYARRIYDSNDQRPNMEIAQGGRRPEDQPMIVLPYGSGVEENDHLVFPDGATFRVIRSMSREPYDQFRVEDVNA